MWIIDFEASSLSRQSYPIEVGVTNGSQGYSSLIRPMEYWTDWSRESESIHNISRNTLLEYGIRADLVARELNTLLTNAIVYCDAIAWDSFWARVLYSDNGLHQRFEIRDITDLIANDEPAIIDYLRKKESIINSDQYTAHRALDDAKIIWHSLPERLHD